MTIDNNKLLDSDTQNVKGSKIKQSRPVETLPPSYSLLTNSKDATIAITDNTIVVFSSQKSQFTDYTTWKGIETKTGITQKYAVTFLVKELLDNALDYLETPAAQHHHNNTSRDVQAKIHVIIEKIQGKYIRVVASNSNCDHDVQNKAAFSSHILKSIFDFNRYHSSKRNQFKITKAALGDALKEVLCIPYVLAREAAAVADWNYPLYIISQQKLYKIELITDRINQTITSKISESDFVTARIRSYHPGNTEIILTMPIIDGYDYCSELYRFVSDYSMFVTHVKVTFEDKNNDISVEFPQLQKINSKWRNHSSIYHYKRKEFHEFILGLDNNDSIVYNVLYKTFREATNLPKSQITQMTVNQLKHSSTQIDRLYDEMRNSMSAPATLALPFDIAKKVRGKALEQRVLDTYGPFKQMKYRSTTGFYSDGDGTQIPFYFEIAIFHDVYTLQRNKINLVFKQAINGSALPTTGWTPFSGCEFDWTTKGSKYMQTAHSIYDIFAHFGYAYFKDKPKKPHSLILANLVSPKIDYQSYGKSRIDFSPFASNVSETVVLACMGGGRSSDGKPSKREVLLEILEDRKYKWNSMDEVQRPKHMWTQSDVFYATRKLLIDTYHYSNEEIDRNYITGLIKQVCEDDLDVKREDIGILAADRAQLYFKGKWMDVGLKEIEQLSLYGIALLIIEKEGVAEQLRVFADEKGIALLNTRGFLTEYAEILSKKSEIEGCKVAILTDFDASGLVLAAKAPNAYRIGIDFETLDDLGLDIKDVEEEYSPGTHLDPLEKYDGKMHGVYPSEWIDYVSTKRVEINSVTEELSDNQKFWDWIVDKLRAKFTNWDYTRAVDIPKPYRFRPIELDQLNALIDTRISAILQPEINRCQLELSDYPEFIDDVSDYEEKLYVEFEYVLNGDGVAQINNSCNGSDASMPTEQFTQKNFLKKIRKDLAKLVKKYGNVRAA